MLAECQRALLRAALIALCVVPWIGAPSSAAPATAPDAVPHVASVTGRVLDAQTGTGLAGVTVTIALLSRSTQTDGQGRFSFTGVPIGTYTLRVEHPGYASAVSDAVQLGAGAVAIVTMALQAGGSSATERVIAHTSVRAGESLQKSSIIYRELSPAELAEDGVYRGGDALRELPAINNSIAGDTAALSDDLQLDLRGIGTLETTTTLDGHRIAYGVPSGFNYQVSPIVGMRAIDVVYGSGSNALGTSAIGGIVNFSTLEPTAEQRATISQGWGTFDKTVTTLQATGTAGRLGYAAAGGVTYLDGPLNSLYLYQPGAAYDQSATDPAVRNLGIYLDDSAATTRSGLLKLRYALSGASSLTFTTVATSEWNNKTGNGDGDYAEYGPLVAFGNQQQAAFNAAPPNPNPCPSGTFIASNANGVPNGTGPNGQPDGGMMCQTPQQYAGFNAGWQGAGTAWQAFNVNDYDLSFATSTPNSTLRLDAYTNRYLQTISRRFALPFLQAQGDSPQAFTYNANVAEAGVTLTDTFSRRRNDLAAGLAYLNTAYNLYFDSTYGATDGAPIVQEEEAFLHDVYRAIPDRLTAYLDLSETLAGSTRSWSTDPRAALVYTPTARDVLRVAAGATSTQPSGDQLDQPFVGQVPGGAGGGPPITCDGLNSIGSAPSSVLKPERGVDEEVALGHRFFADTQAQFVWYNEDIYGKIYQTLAPLSETGTSFIDPQFLQQATAAVAAKCGAAAAPSLLGVTGNLNVGQLRAQGFMLNGRIRAFPQTYFDFDWTLDSTTLQSAPQSYFENNLTSIQGSQLPRLPLHTFLFAADQTIKNVDIRYTLHTVSANNTKAMLPYNFSELRVASPLGPGRISAGITNLFNQAATIEGLRYEGVPLAMNSYATAADYAQYTGANATEKFGLPYRAIFLNYIWSIKQR
jgi:outer membrane receptor for ferrienterochelin and colicin